MEQSQIDRLMELKRLLDAGILTKEEVEKEKAKIFGSGSQSKESDTVKITNTESEQPITLKVDKPVSQDNEGQEDRPSALLSQTAPAKKRSRLPLYIFGSLLLLLLLFFLVRRNKALFFGDDGSSNTACESSTSDGQDNNDSQSDGNGGNSTTDNSNTSNTSSSYDPQGGAGANNYTTPLDKFEKMWRIGTSRSYTYDDFDGWSKADLRILRNYYFAKNNYCFDSKELNSYFSERYPWFRPLYPADDNWFSQLQHDNVQFIKQLEKR